MKNFDKKTYNKEYYKNNRKYILHRKKLRKSGKELPSLEKRHQDGVTIVVFGDLVVKVERSC
jgi:hypothetical protein